MKPGDKVKLTKETLDELNYPEDGEYVIQEILDGEDYKYAVRCEDKMGHYWVQFFEEKEMVLL
jgi:hypothetical protein